MKMVGEQPGDENANDPRSFLSKPRWQRLIIAFAGPAMNIVLAVRDSDRPVHGAFPQDSFHAVAGNRLRRAR